MTQTANLLQVVRHLLERSHTAARGTFTRLEHEGEYVTINYLGEGHISMLAGDENTFLGKSVMAALDQVCPRPYPVTTNPKRLEH